MGVPHTGGPRGRAASFLFGGGGRGRGGENTDDEGGGEGGKQITNDEPVRPLVHMSREIRFYFFLN